jgi:preprotein translocase subunit YajC
VDGSGALFLILLIGLMYVVVVLPRRRQMARQQQLQASLAIGSEVVTIGGIKAQVVDMAEGTVDLAVAPGVVVTFIREAVARVESSPHDDADDAPSEEGNL